MQHVVIVGARSRRIEHGAVVEVIHHPGRLHHIDGLVPLGLHHVACRVGPGVLESIGAQIGGVRDLVSREDRHQMRRPGHLLERPVGTGAQQRHTQPIAFHLVAQVEVEHAVVEGAVDKRALVVAGELQCFDGRMLLQLFRQRAVIGLVKQEAVQCEGRGRDEGDVRAVIVDRKHVVERLPSCKRRLVLLRLRADHIAVACRQIAETRQRNGGGRHQTQTTLAHGPRVLVGRVYLQPADAGRHRGHGIACADVRQHDDGHIARHQGADVGVQRVVGIFAHVVLPFRGDGRLSAVDVTRQRERVANAPHGIVVGAVLRGVEVHRGSGRRRTSPRERIVRLGKDFQFRIATGRGRPGVAEIKVNKVAGDEPLHALAGADVAHSRRLLVVVAIREVAQVVPAETGDVLVGNTVAVGVERHSVGIRLQRAHFSCGVTVLEGCRRGTGPSKCPHIHRTIRQTDQCR